jgi:CheY-like chemotaxis protein
MEELTKNQFRNIMIIDDDEDDCALMAETLNEIDPDIKCKMIYNGRDAFDHIVESKEKPSIIFLDIHMPQMSGIEFLKLLKADPEFLPIPVVICSDSRLIGEMEECKKLGAIHFIMKPASFVLIKYEIRKALKVIDDSLVA